MFRQLLAGILSFIFLFIFLFVSVPFYFYRGFVIRIASRNQNFGKILSYTDSIADDEKVSKTSLIPSNSLVFLVVLEGKQLELSELRELFEKNVLNAKLVKNGQLRYPELQQHLTSFMGYKFWKQDENFRIENHIVEELGQCENLSLLHENLLNKSFPPGKSPWELILHNENEKQSSILALRINHTMCDAKSILKLFVQCLGQKAVIKTANEQNQRIVNPVLNALNFIPLLMSAFDATLRGFWHPWMPSLPLKRSPFFVSLSSPLSLKEIKAIGRNQGVTGSSVIMALITGAIHNLGEKSLHKPTPSWYQLPKENHPDVFANHAYVINLNLPVNQKCPLKRLEMCSEVFNYVKKAQPEKSLARIAQFIGVLGGPLRRLVLGSTIPFPINITNVAGELEGFEVGGRPVSHFSMSSAVPDCTAAVEFAAFSYKEHIHISVVARSSILSREKVERIASGVQKELNVLIGLNQKQIVSENDLLV